MLNLELYKEVSSQPKVVTDLSMYVDSLGWFGVIR
jgi:hypothetical protein